MEYNPQNTNLTIPIQTNAVNLKKNKIRLT